MSAVDADNPVRRENTQSTEYVDFWNEILVPKFMRYKHVLVGGPTGIVVTDPKEPAPMDVA